MVQDSVAEQAKTVSEIETKNNNTGLAQKINNGIAYARSATQASPEHEF